MKADMDFLYLVKLRRRDLITSLYLSELLWVGLIVVAILFSLEFDFLAMPPSITEVSFMILSSTIPVSLAMESINRSGLYLVFVTLLFGVWFVFTTIAFGLIPHGSYFEINEYLIPSVFALSALWMAFQRISVENLTRSVERSNNAEFPRSGNSKMMSTDFQGYSPANSILKYGFSHLTLASRINLTRKANSLGYLSPTRLMVIMALISMPFDLISYFLRNPNILVNLGIFLSVLLNVVFQPMFNLNTFGIRDVYLTIEKSS